MIINSGSGLNSMTIPVPNIIASSPGGGRFDFDDGGTYCGGWQDGKAHGHGVCTGPKNVGEYSGSWNFGFEMSGVYKWKNGAVYEGRWQNGKRHGVGVEYNGKWVYKGEWSQGFKGRYGVKASSNSAVRYEGTWASGLQDGYGSETYADGGYYQGQMCRGLRHGYGVRKSAPYGDSQLNNPNKNGSTTLTGAGLLGSMMIHSNSLQSANSVELDDDSPKPEDGFKPNIDRTLASKNGFVLVSKPLDVPMQAQQSSPGAGQSSSSSSSRFGSNFIGGKLGDTNGGRRNSLTNRLINSARIPGSSPTASLLRGLRLRKQKSTSDLDGAGRAGSAASGRQSAASGGKYSADSAAGEQPVSVPFTLSPEELDISDPTTVETYTGEWKQDKRNGHGVCERSDGLKYEGQWHNDMKSGYGVTTFKDGTKEEGKYKSNILIVDSKVKRFFQLNLANVRQRVDEAVKMAHQAQTMALRKAEIADTRAATARDKADQAATAALEAARDSQIAFSVARQYSDQQQVQLQLQQQQQLMGNQQSATGGAHFQFGMDLMQQQQQQPTNQQQQQQPLSPLQRRRISSNPQAPQFGSPFQVAADSAYSSAYGNQPPPGEANLGDQQQRQFLGPSTEPFNGRRGSFRGGSLGGGGGGGGGGHHFGPAGNFTGQQQRAGSPMGPNSQQNAPKPVGGYGATNNNQRSQRHSPSDPFNDLFDHYKSSASGRRVLSRQASLDQQQMRHMDRLRAGAGQDQSHPGALRRSRMWSLDHADENRSQSPQLERNRNSAGNSPVSEHQLRHLVTSGEELLLQKQQAELAAQSGQTPTNSSYILPQSTGGSSNFYGNPTPSPDNSSGFRPPSSQPPPQPPPAGYATGLFQAQFQSQQHQQQRDVHSLADEQLYLASRRAYERPYLLEQRGEFSKNDFAISTGPRLSHRLLRRTNSLSRNTPIRLGAELGQYSASSTNFAASTTVGRSASPASFSLRGDQLFQQPPLEAAANHKRHLNQSLADQANCGQRLSPDNGGGSLSGHVRKPSLQTRYNPVELGGLMSREEAAALSHAQREQKRLEAELAERRATRPLLHLYLSLREFAYTHRLVIAVLFINGWLMKLFADLIA